MSLANKYRPKIFDTVIAQGHVTDILKAQIQSEKDNHSNYILFWPRWTGKTTIARILAKAINCLNLSDWNPCNECANCRVIDEWKTLDYVEIDAASHTWVDNIREEIIDKIPYPPTQLKKKIYVIDEVHMLSKWAFNALLKTIEEPKSNVCFILATTEINKVPDTIISRCQVFNFRKVPEIQMVGHLQNICNQENLTYQANALEIIAKISEWCVRDAVKYIDQVSILWDISEDHITKFLWVASQAMIQDFLWLLKKQDLNQTFSFIDNMYQQWVDLHNFAKQSLMYIDQNLSEDMQFLLSVSDVFTDILWTIRYYPYPAIVYKIAINKYTNPESTSQAKPVSQVQSNQVNPTPVQSSPKEEVTTTKQEESIPSVPVERTENEKLLDQVLSKIDRPSLSKSLKEHIVVDWVEDGLVLLVAINKMTHILLDKPENIDYLEKMFSEVLWKNLKIKLTYESKEQYFARKLG